VLRKRNILPKSLLRNFCVRYTLYFFLNHPLNGILTSLYSAAVPRDRMKNVICGKPFLKITANELRRFSI